MYGPRYGLIPNILVILAVVAFVIACLLGFGAIDKHSAAAVKDAIGWLGLGGALFAAAHL
jgi:hypothetical protein